MIARATALGGARYIDASAGGEFQLTKYDRLVIVKGRNPGPAAELVLPYAGINTAGGNEASYVNHVEAGWQVSILQYESTSPTLSFKVQTARNGVFVGTYSGNKFVVVTLVNANNWIGTWKGEERTAYFA